MSQKGNKKSNPPPLKLNMYNIIGTCVEQGIERGYKHAHKHTDNPDADGIRDHIYEGVMNNLSEVINFDEP